MRKRVIDTKIINIHNRVYMAEESGEYQPIGLTKLKIPKQSELYNPGKSFRSGPSPSRRGLFARVIGIAAGALGAAWGGSKLLETAIDKDHKVQDAQIEAHNQQNQSQTNIEIAPSSK